MNQYDLSLMSRSIHKFIWRIFCFLTPCLLLIGIIEFGLWRTEEILPISLVVKRQQNTEEETIFRRQYFSDQFNVYKLANIKYRQPKILVIGSSRTMQFRDFMFTPFEKDFYTGGGMIQGVGDLQEFMLRIEQKEIVLPKVLIIGVDPWWIKTTSDFYSWETTDDEVFSFNAHINLLREVIKKNQITELFQLPEKSPQFQYRAFGITARRSDAGFRRDGSLLYGWGRLKSFIQNPVYKDQERPPVIKRVKEYLRQFSLPAIVDTTRVNIILSFVEMLKKLDVEVYAFMPPFSDEVMAALRKNEPLLPWWNYYVETLPDLLKQHGAIIIPVSSPSDYGLDDRYMLDGFHPSEVYIAYIVRELVKALPETAILHEVNIELLSSKLAKAKLPLAFELPAKSPIYSVMKEQ